MSKERTGKELADWLEAAALANPQHYGAYVCRGIVFGLRGNLKAGLKELDRAISLELEEPDGYFWKGMLCAYYYQGRYHAAIEAIEESLLLELQPVLLTPLYWFEKERPDFFEHYAKLDFVHFGEKNRA
jgi:tetratricopeptide (TPR) repeat protein